MKKRMGKSHTYRQWAVTVTGPNARLPVTPREGREFQFAGKSWLVVVGPPEGGTSEEHPNQHLGIKCLTYAVSKSAARAALLHTLECSEDVLQDCYFKQVEMSWARWVNYCFKQKMGTVGSAIRTAQERLRKEGRLPTKRAIQEVLATEHDFEYYCKRLKPALNEYVSLDCMADDRGTRRDKMDPEANKVAFEKSFAILQGQIYLAVTRDRCVTTWEPQIWQRLSYKEKRMFCELLALLPICTKRSVNVPDKLPGLYLWGPPNTGKSAFFDNGVFLRKFPQDSQGVSRFRLELMNSGLLFDDVPDGFMDRQDISGTVRQMVLGGNTTIKTHGTTETVVGYVIVTSNNRPHHLLETRPADVDMTDEQWERNQAAWKRRFVTLELRESIDTDPISVMWSDSKLRDYAACLVIQICRLFAETCSDLYERYLADLASLLLADYCNGEEEAPASSRVISYQQACSSPTWSEPGHYSSRPNAFNILMSNNNNNRPVCVVAPMTATTSSPSLSPMTTTPTNTALSSSVVVVRDTTTTTTTTTTTPHRVCQHGKVLFCRICGVL